jgi:ABC-type transport system substrate-binding protein
MRGHVPSYSPNSEAVSVILKQPVRNFLFALLFYVLAQAGIAANLDIGLSADITSMDPHYHNGFGLTIHGPNNRYINDDKIAQTVAQLLRRINIDAKVETMPSSVFFTRATKLEFSLMLLGWGAESGEASSPLKALRAHLQPRVGPRQYQPRALFQSLGGPAHRAGDRHH